MANHDLLSYKESKITCEHLEKVLLVLKLATKSLYIFRAYIPVAKILLVMEDQRKILEENYVKFKKIKEEKGKV